MLIVDVFPIFIAKYPKSLLPFPPLFLANVCSNFVRKFHSTEFAFPIDKEKKTQDNGDNFV